MHDDPTHREIRTPITKAQLRPLSPLCQRIQFSEPLTQRDHKKLAAFAARHPRICLRVYGHYFKKCDLSFLQHYPTVRHLAIDIFELEDFEPLQFVSPRLASLQLGRTSSMTHSLNFLERFPKLQRLEIEGHAKDIDIIGSLSGLEDLTLSYITLPDLSILKPLKRLHSLRLKLGGTSDLKLLPQIGRLRNLELLKVRGLCNLAPIAAIRSLQSLYVWALRQVTALPSLARLRSLRHVHLETMKGLTDLRPVAKAPFLEELIVYDMRHLEPESLQPFVGHPRLRRASVYLGSDRKNEAVARVLNLPPAKQDSLLRRM